MTEKKQRKKITWIRIVSGRDGGAIYAERSIKALADCFNVEIIEIKSNKSRLPVFRPIFWLMEIFKIKGESDLWLMDDIFTIALLPLMKIRGKKVGLVYHIDFSVFSPLVRLFYGIIYFFFKLNIGKLDALIVISDYWIKEMEKIYRKKIYRITPSLSPEIFKIDSGDLDDFRKRFNLEDKPIIYIGNCQEAKGVRESYSALKDLDVYLVTSGKKRVEIPALNLDIDYPDQLKLLGASSVAVLMSKFNEGWCMTAHEAMFLKTPVIGSGRGGMEELLNKGGQLICRNFSSLRETTETVLGDRLIREEMKERGRFYSLKFDPDYFKESWLKTAERIIYGK